MCNDEIQDDMMSLSIGPTFCCHTAVYGSFLNYEWCFQEYWNVFWACYMETYFLLCSFCNILEDPQVVAIIQPNGKYLRNVVKLY